LSSGSSWRNAADTLVNAVPAPSPETAPTIGSDADSLELAAGASSQNNNGAGVSKPGAQTAPDPAQQVQAANAPLPNNKTIAKTPVPPTPSPAPSPIPPRAQPQMPPAPSPEIALNRAPQLESEPDLSQGPVKERNGDAHRRGNDSAPDNSNWGLSGDVNNDSERDAGYTPNRRRNNDTFNRRRQLDPQNRDDDDRDDRDDDDDDDEDDSARIGPKLYQWSGRVDDQREIRIELPGVPGTVEIPRAYRHRVGVVEPPSANNRWRCVVLRVFGRGGVSIVVRWWPVKRNGVKLTAWR
jgi:hypothetical protein